MCIIAYLPKGAKIADKTITTMFGNNPDGSGIMWKPSDKSDVEIRKGFMNVADLLDAFHKIPVDCERAIHCRIATAGKISVACCHPFPVRKTFKEMTKAEDHADAALMHNGVISFCNPTGGLTATYSDSMAFAATILYPLRNELDKHAIKTLIENCTSSRLLIMRKNGETLRFGVWEKDGDVYYSNSTYSPSGWRYGGCGSNYMSSYCYDYATTAYSKAAKKAKTKAKTCKEKAGALAKSFFSGLEKKFYSVAFSIDVTATKKLYPDDADFETVCNDAVHDLLSKLEADGYDPSLIDEPICDDGKELIFEVYVNGFFQYDFFDKKEYEGAEIIDIVDYEDGVYDYDVPPVDYAE